MRSQAQSSSRRRAGSSRPKGYDTEQIRDFLHHLLLEVRLHRHELEHGPGSVTREMAEAVGYYAEEYSPALLPTIAIDPDSGTGAECREAVEVMRARELERLTAAEAHLEALLPLVEEALEVVRTGQAEHVYPAEGVLSVYGQRGGWQMVDGRPQWVISDPPA